MFGAMLLFGGVCKDFKIMKHAYFSIVHSIKAFLCAPDPFMLPETASEPFPPSGGRASALGMLTNASGTVNGVSFSPASEPTRSSCVPDAPLRSCFLAQSQSLTSGADMSSPTAEEIRTVARKAVTALTSQGLSCCLFGSAACLLYGNGRAPNVS